MLYNGFHTDMAITVGVGKVSKEAQRLMDVAQQSLRIIEENIAPGVDWQYISRLAQQHVEKHGFGMVRSLVGHGVGKDIHEEPQLPNYVIKDYHLILKEGMVLACEPMVTAGSYQVDVLDDEWTFATTDGSLSAHFENSIAVTSNGAEILTGE
jgi:methionyl aminopeptidase